jgi:hypothetical protein
MESLQKAFMPFADQRQHYFPFDATPAITVKAVTLEEVYAVTSKLSEQVFTPETALGLVPFTPTPPALREQYSQHAEQFVFYDGDKPVGWSIGEQRQGDTFFMTWTGILPAYQRQGIYGGFLNRLKAYIGSLGYERLTSNHMVNNRRVLIAKLKADFIITGFSLDERIGAVVWLTHFFNPDRSNSFEKAFSLEHYE